MQNLIGFVIAALLAFAVSPASSETVDTSTVTCKGLNAGVQ